MIKVVHFTTSAPGGAGRAAVRCHMALQRGYAESRIVFRDAFPTVPNSAEMTLPRYGNKLIQIIRTRINRPKAPHPRQLKRKNTYFTDCRSFYRPHQIEAFLPIDVAHLHWISNWFDWPTMIPWLSKKAPIVWTLDDMYPFMGVFHYEPFGDDWTPVTRRWDAATRAAKQRTMDGIPRDRLLVAGPSQWMVEEARKSEVLGRFDIRLVPYSLDLECFRPIEKAIAKQALGLDPSQFIIGFGADGAADPRKGDAVLQAALAKCGDLSLTQLTVGDFENERQEVEGNRISLGMVKRERLLALFFNAIDVFVCPSLQECFGQVVFEALACATPVIGSDVGGIPDMVRSGESGWLFPPGDSDALAAAIRKAYGSADLRAKMGRNGRKICEAEYALEIQAKAYLAIYEELLERSRNATA